MTAELTQIKYTQRRSELVNQIRVAKDDHARASLNLELGTADPAQVSAAREAVAALEDRVLGLDAAWKLVCERAAESAAQAEETERKAAAATIRKLLKTRLSAMKAIQKAMTPVAGAVAEFRKANDEIVQAARPHSRLFGRDGLQLLRSTTHPGVPLEQRLMAALLFEAGINLNGMDGRYHAGKIEDQTLDGLVEADNRNIARFVEDLTEGDLVEG